MIYQKGWPRAKRDPNKRKARMIRGYEVEDAINAVLNWSNEDGNEDFDPSFVESLAEKHDQFGQLTERQETALENIVTKFRIDVGRYL